MICFHKRYNLGDKHEVDSDAYASWDEMEEGIRNEYNVVAMKPLYLFDHSGITISTRDFNDRWDSGRIGFVIITKDNLKKMCGDTEYTIEQIYDMLEGEVDTYDKFLRGDVYSYTIYEVEKCSLGHKHESVLESCGGYYSEAEARTEAESIMKYYEDKTAIAYHG
jgi:hypothetical protein